MPSSLRLLALASLLPLSSIALFTACGQTNDMPDASADAAPDKTTADVVAMDAAEEPDVSCPPPLNLDGGLPDAGGFGPCLTCLTTNCGSQIAACNASCTCRGDVASAIACFGMGGSPTTCINDLLGSNEGAALLGCGFSHCQSACLGGGGDGGSDAATDAPADAPADAPGGG